MSSDLTREEQRMFADKVGKPKDPVFVDPLDNQEVVLNPGGKVPNRFVKKGGKQRRIQKSRKRNTNARRTRKYSRLHKS